MIRVRRTQPLALVLTAYEPTQWTVKLETGAPIDTVIATGNHRQEVILDPLDPTVEVITLSAEDDGEALGVAFSWPSPG